VDHPRWVRLCLSSACPWHYCGVCPSWAAAALLYCCVQRASLAHVKQLQRRLSCKHGALLQQRPWQIQLRDPSVVPMADAAAALPLRQLLPRLLGAASMVGMQQQHHCCRLRCRRLHELQHASKLGCGVAPTKVDHQRLPQHAQRLRRPGRCRRHYQWDCLPYLRA